MGTGNTLQKVPYNPHQSSRCGWYVMDRLKNKVTDIMYSSSIDIKGFEKHDVE